jgi:hemoglobin-like flavoprotein
MNPSQIQLVQDSFELVKPIAGRAAELFYQRLFELDPSLRPLFKDDLRDQQVKLMATLSFAVAGLKQPDQMLGAVRQLGQRHAGYGVRPAHYQTVGAALLWTLAQGLGERFTPEVAAAWTALFAVLAGAMQTTTPAAEPA